MYVDIKHYRKVFKGTFSGRVADLRRMLRAASAKVDELTFGRIARIGFDGLTPFQQECVKEAVCHQADYYARNGVENGGAIRSYRALDVSVWYDRLGNSRAEAEGFSQMGFVWLERSGLTARSV